jgi:RNA polymerase sigma-70 factor, ECF subfamily
MNDAAHTGGPTDEQSMWRVQMLDDHEAFALVVDRWEHPILRLCIRMTGDAHRAEDIKQETFARVYSQRKTYRPGGRFSTWLWRIALNLCHDDLRRRRSRIPDHPDPGEGAPEPTDPSTPAAAAAEIEERELLRRALLEMAAETRSAVVLRVCESLPFREVAEILGVPETTARRRVAEGLETLTRLLEPAFATPAADTVGGKAGATRPANLS